MTGGRVCAKSQKYVDGDTFLLTYGDGVSDVNIRRVLEFHKSHGKIATVTTVPPISRFGMLEVAGEGRVTNFTEKPKMRRLHQRRLLRLPARNFRLSRAATNASWSTNRSNVWRKRGN